jgi:hypothetical protein
LPTTVALRSRHTSIRRIETGYRFSARADLTRHTLTWCKRNPRPLHPVARWRQKHYFQGVQTR